MLSGNPRGCPPWGSPQGPEGLYVWGGLQHVQVPGAHTKEECRRNDKRNSVYSIPTLQCEHPPPTRALCLPVSLPASSAVGEESEPSPCCRRSTEQEDQCQACPEAMTPAQTPPLSQVCHMVAKSGGPDTSQPWCISAHDSSVSPVAPEVSVGAWTPGSIVKS